MRGRSSLVAFAVLAAVACIVWAVRRVAPPAASASREAFTTLAAAAAAGPGPSTSAVACPPDMVLYADDKGALRCCAGSVNYFRNTCGASQPCPLAGGTAEEKGCAQVAAEAGQSSVCPAGMPHLTWSTVPQRCCAQAPTAEGGCPPLVASCSVGGTGSDACPAAAAT